MDNDGLNHQVEAYDQWRKGISREIGHYQGWLNKNSLLSDEITEKLQGRIQRLKSDGLTIAFVGEFSRGKTELINALFFTGFGQRMLPSQAGRTTMCPSEIFFDPSESPCLKLLPIETRHQEHPVSHYKSDDVHWKVLPLRTNDPVSMRELLNQVSESKSVSFEEARKLGFDVGTLEKDLEHPGQVLIPAWRHALVNMDHPVLRQGVRILDTPGLNSLGAEPELTVSMLPRADAILFVLDADAGVTASDMDIWMRHLRGNDPQSHTLKFAVLNKIDTLMDELRSAAETRAMIETVRISTAEQLGLDIESVLPLSARQGLIGRIRGDQKLLQESRLEELEQLIAEQLITRKEKQVTTELVADILGMLQNSVSILSAREASLSDRLERVEEGGVGTDYLKELTTKTQTDYNFYYKKLFTLRSSRRLMKSQAMILGRLLNSERFEQHARLTQEELVSSWTTLGMGRSIVNFFHALENDLANLRHESVLAGKMVTSIYQRYNQGLPGGEQLEPRPFDLQRTLDQLGQLQNRAERFRLQASTLFSEQTVVVKRFFNTLVLEARDLYLGVSEDAQRWPQEALMPLLQNTLEQKESLEHQIKRLKELSATARDTRSQQRKLQQMIQDIRSEIQEAENIQRRLRRPAPQSLQQKVVNLPGAVR